MGDPVEPDQPCPGPTSHMGEAEMPGFWQSENGEKGKGQQSLMGVLISLLGQTGPGRWVWLKLRWGGSALTVTAKPLTMSKIHTGWE